MPVVFMTAWHALNKSARVRAGEWILVHAGAGGVGMAAIQIAHHLGAKVIASAGSPAKRALLKTLGVEEVIDSRRGDFAEQVMELTDRRGVDVVLNALASEAIPMGLSCLAEYGRFIEIGKRDIYQNSRLPLWALRRNASFHVVAMDAVFAGDEALTRELMAEITGLLEQRALTPLPYRTFPASRVDAAFRLMAAGKHTGKVVIAFADPFVVRRGEAPRPEFDVDSQATYLITGGLGGFGKVLSNWLVECGARHLVLTGRQWRSRRPVRRNSSRISSASVRMRWSSRRRGFGGRRQEGLREHRCRGFPAQGRLPPRHGHRRRAACRSDAEALRVGDGTEGRRRMAASRADRETRPRLLRDVLLDLEHLR